MTKPAQTRIKSSAGGKWSMPRRGVTQKDAVAAAIRAAIHAKARGSTTISVIAAGELLGLGRDAAYAAAESGALPTLKICARRWRVSVAVVERLLLGDELP